MYGASSYLLNLWDFEHQRGRGGDALKSSFGVAMQFIRGRGQF